MKIIAKIQAKKENEGKTIQLTGELENKPISRLVTYEKIKTKEMLAEWLVAQLDFLPDSQPDTTLQKEFEIEYHLETVVDEEAGEPVEVKVIDSVVASSLPWVSCHEAVVSEVVFSGDELEAVQWVETNVTDFATAKSLLKKIAGAVVLLQRQIKGLSEDRY